MLTTASDVRQPQKVGRGTYFESLVAIAALVMMGLLLLKYSSHRKFSNAIQLVES